MPSAPRAAFAYRWPRSLLQFFAPREGLLIETDSESPAGAGISGSSALMIAATSALARFTERNLTLEQMRVIAQNVEAQIIAVPTGCQDYYPALYGGVSAIHLDADGIHREAVPVMPEEIEVAFRAGVHGSAATVRDQQLGSVQGAHQRRSQRSSATSNELPRSPAPCTTPWRAATGTEVARLLREEWKLRRSNAPGITTPLIDKLIAVAGATAAKPPKPAAPEAEAARSFW